MMLSPNRLSGAARLFVLLVLLTFAFAPVFAQETASPTTTTTIAATPAADTVVAPAAPAAEPAATPAAPAAAPIATAAPAAPAQLSFYEDAPAADRDVVASSRALTESGKWLSAWKLLAGYDAANTNPWILAEKIRIADEGFAQSIMHLVFGFVDLAEGEDLASVRENAGEGVETTDFKPAELAAAIEASGAALPPVLSLALGDYYYEVWTRYKGQWMEEDSVLLAKGAEQYERALAYETFTPDSLGRQSDILVALQRFDGAEAVVRKGLELNPGSHELTLKLGDVLYGADRYTDVYPIADGLIADPASGDELNDAFILAIKAGLGAQDRPKLEKYLADYEKGFPSEYMPGLVRHLVMVRLGDAQAADAAADALDVAFPGNPDVIRSVLSTWLSVNDTASGFKYLDRCLAKNPADEAAAALYFYRALLGYQSAVAIENVETALSDLATAEEHFTKAYPPDSQVFGTIKQLRDEWTQALASAKAGATAAPAAGDAAATQPAASSDATTPAASSDATATTPAASSDATAAQPAEGSADATTAATAEQ
jgi:tetratricopeptide (TPR) repeat protein